eukprot:TRINITY_DN2629_c0_g1_i4.p1 TRINITY_DN2629_c0_g1~~TRINITY_DN2629_c0_g1_i4.p1  ORF type:complete len:440 (-),score=5.12 TRINITY_DN2629_c0_g1_i4:61-1320(-)
MRTFISCVHTHNFVQFRQPIRQQRIKFVRCNLRPVCTSLEIDQKVDLKPGVKQVLSLPKRDLTWSEVAQHSQPSDCWIVVNNKVYDVTEFVEEHPGGKVIMEFAGKDASEMFETFHSKKAWQQLSEFYIGQIQDSRELSKIQKEFLNLRQQFKRDGLFESNKLYYAWKVFSNQCIWAAAVYTLFQGPQFMGTWPTVLVSTILTSLYWQQSGWLSHDFLHHQVFPENRWLGTWTGYVLGNLAQGFSVEWWKFKHNTHHALPNQVDENGVAVDPDIDALPLLSWSVEQLTGNKLENFMVKNQLYTFFPIVCLARVGWAAESFLHSVQLALKKNEFAELVALCLHYTWLLGFAFYTLPPAAATAYVLGSEFLGGFLIGIVFIISHNGMEIISDSSFHIWSLLITSSKQICFWFYTQQQWLLQ